MARPAVLGAIVPCLWAALWAAGPAAAQSAQWQSFSDDGACVAEYAPGEGVSARLTRKFGGATVLTYAFVTPSYALVGDGEFDNARFGHDISIAQPPSQAVSVTGIILDSYDEATAFNPDARIIVSIAVTDALLAWIAAEKPGYTILYGGKIIRQIRFPDPAPAQRLIAPCTPTIREVNRPLKPIGRRDRWMQYERIETDLEGLSGRRRVVMGLTVGTDGRVRDCSVKASTGSAPADDKLCAQLARNARFEPATDGTGQLLTGTYDYSFVLEL